ncbi:MAG: TetR family transcriptional regulator [Rhizobiales bacterium]|nr:TetR family transcriptional regulator [Hyphomicrobiales bacterium]
MTKAPTRHPKSTLPPKKTSPRPVRRRLPPAERRAQIIAAARLLFAAEGIDNVSMRKIASRVGITQAAIYQHFEDKAAIIFALSEAFFTGMIETFEARLAGIDDSMKAFRLSLKAYVEYGLSRPEEYRLIFMMSTSQMVGAGHRIPAGQVDDVVESAGRIAFGYLHDRVRNLVAEGRIIQGDPDAMAEAIWAAGHGIVSLLITHQHYPWSAPEAILESQLDILFNGLLLRSSSSS